MSTQFFTKLSQNYIELLKDDEYYDITIEVGEDPNVKIFRAHMNILCYRSPYLRRILSSNKKNNNNVLTHIKLSNISPKIFQNILEYIYGGVLSLNDYDISDSLKVLAAADNLHLQELNIKDAILSNVRDAWQALDYSRSCGPQFGQDLNISSKNTKSFNVTYCRKVMYERNIRDTEDKFSIEDYEVFQIIRS
ncbi:BTB/POZ protein [Rhizophagus irregularis DAOM 181602=DAOM 197198]|nr:BTB/POZ protein [Rhizophagus irregularis DAOM 181602=DAOM 197198]